MSRSSQSSRSISSSSGKIPLSFQSDPKQQTTYGSRYDDRYSEPRYASTLSSGYSSQSSSSKSSRSSSKSSLTPLSISQGGSSSSRDEGRSKTTDERYYSSSFLDSGKPQKKPLSFQKESDARYYRDSSYYR